MTVKQELLNILKNSDIVIDYIMPIIVSFVPPLLATILGGAITIKINEKNESIKIKQNFKLEFFKKYEEIYWDLNKESKDLLKLSKILYIVAKNRGNNVEFEKFMKQHYVKKVTIISDIMKKNEKLRKQSQYIYEYVQKNKIMFKDNDKLYNIILEKTNELNKISERFQNEHLNYFFDGNNLVNSIIGKECDFDEYNKFNGSKEEIEILKNSGLVEAFSESIIELYEGVHMNLVDLEELYYDVEYEFIGHYFESENVK